jgi:predicted acyltransferase (DUF342 family)
MPNHLSMMQISTNLHFISTYYIIYPMSFRKYGGLNYAKSNNIVRNHLSNIDTLEISDHIGASGSRITCNSELIVTDDIACTNLTAAYDITGTNATITEDTTLNMVQGFDSNPIMFNSELLLEKDLVFAPKTSGETFVKIVFSDGTEQDRLMLTTDTYWQPIPVGNTGSLPDAIFFTKRVVAGVNPDTINDQMAAQGVNFAVNGNAGILGGLYVGASGTGPTFINNFSVKSNGDVAIKGALGVTGAATLYNTLSVAKGATFESDAYIKGALGVTGGVTLYNTLSVAKGVTMQSGLSVASGVTLSSTLYVASGVTLNNGLTVSQGVTLKGALSVASGVTLSSTLYVASGVTFDNGLTVSQGVTLKGALLVASGVTLSSTLYVASGVTLNNGLTVSQGVTLKGALSITSGVTLLSTLYVGGGATFASNLSVPSNISYMAGSQPLIDSLTTVFYTFKDYVPGINFLGCTTRFRKNTPVTSADDVTYDATNGKFTINKVGIYKVSLDMKPYWHGGGSEDYLYNISIQGLDQNYMFMLTSNTWYYVNGAARGYPSYNTTSGINKDTAVYTDTTASVVFANYQSNSNNGTASATATLYFYVNVLSVASGSVSNSFYFQSENANTQFSHSSYVVVEKISTSCFTPNSYSGYT